MNNSMLYHTWGAKGFNVVRTWYTKEGTFIQLDPQKRLYVCPICGSKEVTTRGSIERTIKTLPVGFREDCFFVVNVPRLHCHSCDGLHYLDIKIAEQRKSYTKQLANLITLLFCIATISDIAGLLKMNWATIKDVVKLFLHKKFSKPDFSNITMISIDEISTHKGHKYVTIVIDALTGRPLYVGDGKSEEALDGFWKALGPRRCKRIKAVAIDMGRAYISAVKKRLPHAKIVFDHFHLIKIVNETLNRVRNQVFAAATKNDQRVLTGTKYLLLRNREDLDEDNKKRLAELLALNTPLSAAYILKEDLRRIWEQKSKRMAKTALLNWIERARSTGNEHLIKLANTIKNHAEGILNWYHFPVNSGRIEGINNKIKVMKRRAYGYNDLDFFKLLIMAILSSHDNMVFRLKT